MIHIKAFTYFSAAHKGAEDAINSVLMTNDWADMRLKKKGGCH